MRQAEQHNHDSLPEEILEQAAIWCSKLQDADAITERQHCYHELNQWLEQDPRHLQAYQEMQQLWHKLEQPAALMMTTHPEFAVAKPRQTLFSKMARTALAAGVVMLCLTYGVYRDNMTDYWLSDYHTAMGEDRHIVLADESTITLNSNSSVAVNFTPNQRQIRLLRGEAWFDVASDKNKPFVIDTTHGQITVTGTRFNVLLSNHETRVSLADGEVILTQGGDTLTLSPGQQAALTASHIIPARNYDATIETAWLRGQFVFYNTPLEQVINQLNQHRKGRILIVDNTLKTVNVSGIFSTKEPDAALTVITNTLPIKQVRLTDYLVLLK